MGPWSMCQMGANSAYEDQARKCPVDNTCATPLWSAVCHSTEVCCLTPIAGTCCPFGYSCDCDADSCECVAPALSPTVNSSAAEMWPHVWTPLPRREPRPLMPFSTEDLGRP